MYQIYSEDDILEIVNKHLLYYQLISPFMYIIGISQAHLIGNISIISNELICHVHFNRGYKRFAATFKYEPKRFAECVKLARQAIFEVENYKLDKLLDSI